MARNLIAVWLALFCAVAILSCQGNKTETVSDQQSPKPSVQSSHELSNATESAANKRIPPYYENPDSVVLEPTLDPVSVPPEAQAAYRVAKDKPKLLAQLPCFCYCDRFGHGSLQYCFVSTHAMVCDICMKEALEADQLQNQGMSAADIRSAIIAKYHPQS